MCVMICILHLIQVFCSSIFDICFLENITKCCTGNMISTSLKLLSLTTLIFILNTLFYLPQSFRKKNKVKTHEVHLNLNHSEKANDTIKLPKKIIQESIKKEGMKYILYWNEAYDSKGEPTFYHQAYHILFCFYRVWILLWDSALDRSPVSRYKLLFHT